MNYYNTVFISKINNKLNKIINGIKLLNSINNTISIQSGGGLSEAINTFAKKQLVIYNTEEYEKLVAKFLKEIAILRAVIIELLSQLHKKNQDVYIPISDKELDARVDAAATTIQQPSQKPPKPEIKEKTPETYITPDFTFDNIKIYKLTEDNYISILSLTDTTLWSKDIQMNLSQSKYIYNKANIKNIYIIHITVLSIITPFLVSFVNNDLRDSTNKQLTLNKLYEYIKTQNSISEDTHKKFILWMTDKITEYTQSIKSPPRKTSAQTTTVTYVADNCQKYNIIYNTDSNLTNYTTLKIIDHGTTYNTDTQTFGSVPFYIDIYEFISKFINCTKIDITGDFSAQFYSINLQSTQNMNTSPFNNIAQLVCSNCALTSVNQILKLCKRLQNIKISFTNDQSRKTICNDTHILLFFNKIIELINSKILKTIDISQLLKPENMIQCKFTDNQSKSIQLLFNILLQTVKATSAQLTYND